MKDLTSPSDIDALLVSDEVILLKHGAHCPISARARDEMAAFEQAHPEVTVAAIEVTGHRDVSDYAAERLGVEHQSPQLFILRAGKVAWSAQHYGISAGDLEGRVDP